MGRKSREKRERGTPAAQPADPVGVIQFRVGVDMNSTLPILLHFQHKGAPLFPSAWTVSDARNIAFGLLKYCDKHDELLRLHKLNTRVNPTL